MDILGIVRYALGVSVAATTLSGWGAGGAHAAERSAPQTFSDVPSLTNRGGYLLGSRLNRGRSWMSPSAANGDLLYASDSSNGTVDVYSHFEHGRSPERVGQLTGFEFPFGECVDSAGDVYITDHEAGNIVEYAHGGTTPIKVLAPPFVAELEGCSVDPTTGNLAVSVFNNANGSGTSGGVWIFAGASGTPTFHVDPNLYLYWSPGYDDHGNLFVEGEESAPPTLDELPSGASSFTEISLGSTMINFPAAVMWDGKYVAAADQSFQGSGSTGIYRIRVSGSVGTVVRATALTATCNGSPGVVDIVQPWIRGKEVYGGNVYCTSQFGFWSYANGGNPLQTIPAPLAPVNGGWGETISHVARSV